MPRAPWRSTGPSSTATPRASQMLDGTGDRAVPDEAEVGVARADRVGGARVGVDPRTVHVELLGAEPVRITGLALDDLGAEHVAIERVRAHPVADGDDGVIEADQAIQCVRCA